MSDSDLNNNTDHPLPGLELRLAVTMNGGVSLAVYIGGVAHELNRLTQKNSGSYSALLEYLGYEPIIDVITGTSAGGINGAALALAQANTCSDLSRLRDLWIERGRIESMLRQPFQESPPSLLKGDEYFWPELRSALRGIVEPFERSDRSIDLTITTTLLTEVNERTVDALGTQVIQQQFAGLFRFRGSTKTANGAAAQSPGASATDSGPEMNRDDFAEKTIVRTVEALALASRATAGFPGAFEPTFIPVRCPDGGNPDGRPNMEDYADWSQDTTATDADLSRFVVDGGVLANTPTRPALEGIERMGVEGALVRRVLLLVHPHAAESLTVSDVADRASTPPTLVDTFRRVGNASSSLGSRSYVEEIAKHNLVAERWRDGRREILDELGTCDELREFVGNGRTAGNATPAWKLFRALRVSRGAYVLAYQVRARCDVPFGQLKKTANAALDEWEQDHGKLPFLPDQPPGPGNVPMRTRDAWHWGLDLARGVTALAADITRDAMSDPRLAANDTVKRAYKAIMQADIQLAQYASQEEDNAATDVPRRPDTEFFRKRLDLYEERMTNHPNTDLYSGADVSRQILIATRVFYRVMRAGSALPGTDGLIASRPVLDCPTDVHELLIRLLTIEVAAYLVSESGPTDPTLPSVPIDLVQISAQVPQDFASDGTTDHKLAGMSLHRFGGFLKRSWRANDWIWGRLDAIKILMLIMLAPGRLRELSRSINIDPDHDTATTIVDTIGEHAFGSRERFEGALTDADLAQLYARAIDEVRDAIGADASDHTLTNLAGLASYGVQITVTHDEIPALLAAIAADSFEGATGTYSEAFQRKVAASGPSPAAGVPEELSLLRTFADSRIGREDLAEQMPSDLIIRTAVTAAATTATMLSSERSGLGVARPATKVLRGLVAVPYWAAVGLTHQGVIGRFLSASLLAVGMGFVALSLAAPLPAFVSTLVSTIGISSLIAVFAYAAMRSRSIIHGVALLGLFVLLAPFAGYRIAQDEKAPNGTASASASSGMRDTGMQAGTLAAVAVITLVLGTLVIASLNSPVLSPIATGSLAIRWLRRRRNAIAVMGACVVVGAVAAVTVGPWLWDRLRRWFAEGPWTGSWFNVTTIIAIVIVFHGWVFGWFGARRLRPLTMLSPSSDRTKRTHMPLTDPTGLATAWSAVYGLLYTAVAWALAYLFSYQSQAPYWLWVAPAVALVLGFGFSVVAVHWLPHTRERRLVKKLAAVPRLQEMTNCTDTCFSIHMVTELRKRGDVSCYLYPRGSTSGASARAVKLGKRVKRACQAM